MQTELQEAQVAEFEIVPADSGLELKAKNEIELGFTDIFSKAKKWKEQAAAITDPVLARTARLELKKIRVEGEKKHKELKEDSRRYGLAVDGAKNILLALIVPIEKQLDDIEKKAERDEAARIEALRLDREDQLRALDHATHGTNVGTLTDDQWTAYLQDAKDVFEIRKEREAKAKAEAERIAREEAEERARIVAENARLKKEAEEREAAAAIERAAAEKARIAAEAKAKADRELADKAREEAETKAQAERNKAEAERKAAEAKAAKERAEIEAKAKADRDALEKKAQAERDARLKAEADAQKLRNEEAARQQAEADAKAKAARAPEKEKIMAFAESVRALRVGNMKTPEGNAVAAEVEKKIASFAKWIETQAQTL